MKPTLKKELSTRKSLKSKLKYIFFAYKFELGVTLFIVAILTFFISTTIMKDHSVLNIAAYTSDPPNTYEVSSIQGELNKILKINYNQGRKTSEVTVGSSKKISNEIKLRSMISAKQVDILIINKRGFKYLNANTKNLKPIPKKLFAKRIDKQYLFIKHNKIYGIQADKIPILSKLSSSSDDVLCVPANANNLNEAKKLLICLSKRI